MGRTIPSFRIALEHEKEKWKLFRASLVKSEKENFDKLFLSAKFFISAGMMSKISVRIYPIMMSVLLYQYKRLLSILRELENGNIYKR